MGNAIVASSTAAQHAKACRHAWAAHMASCARCFTAIESRVGTPCNIGAACMDEIRIAEQRLMAQEQQAAAKVAA